MSKAVKATVLLMVVTIFSKILGLARDSVLASVYGTGNVAAVYATANNIPTVLFAVIGSALATSLIPIYNRLTSEDSPERANSFLNSVINIVSLICLGIAVIGVIFTGPIVTVFAPGYTGSVYELCIKYTRILLPSIIFVGLANIYTAYLQIHKRYVVPGFIGLPFNIIIITSILLSVKYGPIVMVVGTLFAIASKAAFQYPFVRNLGYRYSAKIDIHDPAMKDMLLLIIPVVIGVGANQINSIVDKSLASLLGTNIVSSFSYATRLYEFVQALFITSILSVVYPRLSHLVVTDKFDMFIDSIRKTMNVVIVALVPIIVGCMVLAGPIVEVLFQRKAFTPKDTAITATILVFYVVGILAFSLRDVISRGFYSLSDSKTPMYNSIIAIVFNIVLNLILIKPLGYKGLAISTTVSAYIGLFLFVRSMKKKITDFSIKNNIVVFIKCLLAAAVMGLAVRFGFSYMSSILSGGFLLKVVNLAVSIILGVLVYMPIMYLLKVDEFIYLLNLVKDSVKKKLKRS